jgi:hypothetical protein
VREALVSRELWGTDAQPTPISHARERLTREHEFRDGTGTLIAVHGRFESPTGKTFRWRLPDGDWKDGLGALPQTSLPLYRLSDVLEQADVPVFIVEGEKAADACVEHGLVAVSLPGGAAQQRFGNSLDALAGRDVVLWPDNDEAGRGLMQRVAGLLPDADFISPTTVPKGDAYDYFATGGTVENLSEIRRETEPRVSVVGPDAVDVELSVAAGTVSFNFTSLSASARSVDCVMAVNCQIPGLKRRTPYSVRLNLESASATDQVRRSLDKIYQSKELNWSTMLSEAGDSAKEAWRNVDLSVDLADVDVLEERPYLVGRFMPEGLVSILFGMGGSGKSMLALDIALHCLQGIPWQGRTTKQVTGVLIIDYEDIESEWRMRVAQIAVAREWGPLERGLRFVPGRSIPVADQMVQLKRLIAEHDIELVIVDSAVSASGGELLDTTAAARLINSLTDLGVTSLLIAHNTKAEDSQYPYGNIFWHNLARATHYILQEQEEGSLSATVAIYNRKSNRGKQKAIGLNIQFPEYDSGPITIESSDQVIRDMAKRVDGGHKWTVADLIQKTPAPLSVEEIAKATKIDSRAVRKILNDGNGSIFTKVGEGNPQLWQSLSNRSDAVQW